MIRDKESGDDKPEDMNTMFMSAAAMPRNRAARYVKAWVWAVAALP